jgi:PTS system N-acetylglucosamine-specific IIC component
MAGDPSAGAFMSGFFPVMMFGLPGACLAMYRAALPARRRVAGGLLVSLALTSFLTGVTEPIEFTFVFLAPALYALHAILTGTAMVLMDVLGVKLGFSFSAGLFDYLLNYGKATRPLLMLPVGVLYFAVYYFAFRYVIRRFDLRTPGREDEETATETSAGSDEALSFIRALGGAGNIRSLDACMTRLRVALASASAVDEDTLRRLGARGLVRPTADTLQVVVGPIADQLAADMRRSLHALPGPGPAAPDANALLAALGGSDNIASVESASTRLLVAVADDGRVDEVALAAASPRGFARAAPGRVHVIIGPAARRARDELSSLWQAARAR